MFCWEIGGSRAEEAPKDQKVVFRMIDLTQ
jgi:hypothetical protein